MTFVEAARHLAQRMLSETQSDEEAVTMGWRLAVARPPSEKELAFLKSAVQRYSDVYRNDQDAAKQLLGFGESPRDESLDITRHAAFTMVALSILNLDETITLE